MMNAVELKDNKILGKLDLDPFTNHTIKIEQNVE